MIKTQKVYIYTIGCNRRLLDAQRIKIYCEKNGYQITINPEQADYIILNTCAVDNTTESSSIDLVKKFSKFKGKLLIAGCLPKINKQILNKIYKGPSISPTTLNSIENFIPRIKIPFKNIKDQNIFYSNRYPSYIESKNQIVKVLKKYLYNIRFRIKNILTVLPLKTDKNKTIHIRISWGCLGNCSYCAIKRAIGQHESKPINNIIDEFTIALKNGYKYFEFLADDVGAFGLDKGSSFPILLNKILNFSGDFFIYLQDIHPKWLNRYEKELKTILMDKRIIKVGFPIQSGSKRVLNLMHRNMNISKTKNILQFFKKNRPDLKIDTHIIIGFPTETKKDLDKTLKYISDVQFSKVWIYKYDKKIHTEAFYLPRQLSNKTISSRIKYTKIYLKNHNIIYKMIWTPDDSDADQYL